MPDDCVLCKLDFSNAFNSLHRDPMLTEVAKQVPEIYEFCLFAYCQASILQFNTDVIYSPKCGVQQDDLLGPLLFYLTLHPILQSTISDLSISFLDDLTLGGDLNSVELDINQAGANIGLQLNAEKM
jgi:hypothetical protein